MTAAELYEIVKDDPEVWGGWIALDKGKFASLWRDCTSSNGICGPLAEVVLEALYGRATGCGVVVLKDGSFRAYRGWTYHKGPTRLAALVAAYRANKENSK